MIKEIIVIESAARKEVVQRAGQTKPNIFKGTNMDERHLGEQYPNGAIMI